MSDLVTGILSLLLLIGITGGLVYWAKRAETDRAALMGLYLVLGIPGTLLTVAGLALTVNRTEEGWAILLCGLGLALPLVPQVRFALAKVTPLDPKSTIDMAGLSMILLVCGFTMVTYAMGTNEGDETVTGDVTVASLIVNVITFVAIAYVCVGYGTWRKLEEATERLNIRMPSGRTILIGLALVVPSLLMSIVGSALTVFFQPDVVDNLQETMDEMTTGVQNPFGAVLLGLTTGIGEEVLFRGAVQPRFGIVIASLVWVVLHVQYDLTFVLVGLFGIGILLGLERKYLGTSAAIVTHAAYNVVVVLLQTYST